MSKLESIPFRRGEALILEQRLRDPRGFLQVVAGPRQVGKTTMVTQVLEGLGLPSRYASADEPGLKGASWLASQWEAARLLVNGAGEGEAVLALDEVQKIPNWSETVKRLWDEDSRKGIRLKVVLLGSSPFLVQRGLTESLAGRFEVLRLCHWGFREMQEAFGFSLEDFLLYGGYPGAAPLIGDPARWRAYIQDSLIETTLSRDVLLLNRVDKPALLRQLFELGCLYSGQVLSYTKLMGQLQDAGNTTTLAHYLELLRQAGMLTGLRKFAVQVVRQRGSSPKFQVMASALYSAMSTDSPPSLLVDNERRGRLVESVVGAHLYAMAVRSQGELFYWRENGVEVDFVLKTRGGLLAVEVKSGDATGSHTGLEAFSRAFSPDRAVIVGGDGIPLESFLTAPLEAWLPL